MQTSIVNQMQRVAKNNGVILLYHSVMQEIPLALGNTLHNVTVQQFTNHLQDLSDYFKFISLDEFSRANSKAGLACITFDDGYKNVLENAMPVMESMSYPFTLFLNPVTFEHRWNWRDKVRYLIHHHQVDDFLKSHDLVFKDGRFYRFSKHSENNSADMDKALDQFLNGAVIDIYGHYPYLSETDLVDNALINYGNHSQNHYVLASLSDQQQGLEISLAHEKLHKINSLKLSECFSAPFGGNNDVNCATRKFIADIGYHSLLMSRQRIQSNQSQMDKVQILERFMPRTDDVVKELISIA